MGVGGGERRVRGGVTHEFRMKTLSHIGLGYRLCNVVTCVRGCVNLLLSVSSAVTLCSCSSPCKMVCVRLVMVCVSVVMVCVSV